MNQLKKYWDGLQVRERMVIGWGGVAVVLIMIYYFIWQPWHYAISYMENSIQPLRANLVWMRQTADTLKTTGGAAANQAVRGADQSLLSVVQQTAGRARVSGAIQQMIPGQEGEEVRVVLDGVDFNQWVRWIDDLFKQYGVKVKQVTAERDDDKPNTAEVRVTFTR